MSLHYNQLRDRIHEDFWSIPEIRTGHKLPTERELAKKYGVSRPTISKAIAALAAEGWVTKRQGSGIFVASLKKREPGAGEEREARRLGCVLPSLQPVLSHRIFEGVEQVTSDRGWVIDVASSQWDVKKERNCIEEMIRRGAEGIVLYPMAREPRNKEYLAREFRETPIVVVDLYQPEMKRPHFLFDNWSAGREITRYLLSQGRTNIAFLKYPDRLLHRTMDDRLSGYRRALADAGIPFARDHVIALQNTEPLTRDHREALESLLNLNPRPDALISPYDPLAHASIAILREQGLHVPEDILVAGFDDLQNEPWRERFPTTRPDFVRMGERATEMILDRIATREDGISEVVLPCPIDVPGETSRMLHELATPGDTNPKNAVKT